MTLFSFIDILTVAEPWFYACALFAVWKAKGRQGHLAFYSFLMYSFFSSSALIILLHLHRIAHVSSVVQYRTYFYASWTSYLIEAALTYLVLREVFENWINPLAFIKRRSVVAFQWLVGSGMVLGVLISASQGKTIPNLLLAVAAQVMRCISVIELLMLVGAIVLIRILGLSIRDRNFGIIFGFGLMAASNLFTSALAVGGSNMTSTASDISQIVLTCSLLVWTGYFLKPQSLAVPAKVAVSQPPSALTRFNEVVVALNPAPARVVIGEQSGSFLRDVETTVERVMKQNSLDVAS